jgi:flagellar basal-body rod protein FlgB
MSTANHPSENLDVVIEALFNRPNYVAARKLLDASTLRHEAIAANLANIETPGYQRVDIAPSFASDLRQAIAANDPSRTTALKPRLTVDSTAPAASRRDGNNVELESELVRLSQNAVEHSLETHLLTGTLLRLRLAITGRPI